MAAERQLYISHFSLRNISQFNRSRLVSSFSFSNYNFFDQLGSGNEELIIELSSKLLR